ncbi:MAG: HAMP domain-containing histidine kinase [Anaerolineaceae bacterium]|nr:HAMP domain-containing histidine kinase [Anaerolineaceae bacterium]
MKRKINFFQNGKPVQALLESWLLCALLLIPMLPVLFKAPPLALSLYLVQLPMLCAIFAGLRTNLFNKRILIFQEIIFAAVLTSGLISIIICTILFFKQWTIIETSYSGTSGTIFFLLMGIPEYLAVRFLIWGWQYWANLREKRFAFQLTHAIISVVAVFSLVFLIVSTIYTANMLEQNIWGIPSDNIFAQIIFWITVIILWTILIFTILIIIILPITTLFSFFLARKMTVRLEKLAGAAQAFQKGDFSQLVCMEGKDEIAQLQSDFNSMSLDLEKSIGKLKTEKKKIEMMMDARSDFVNEISHELRNPAAIILGTIESIQSEWKNRSSEEIEGDLETIYFEAMRMKTILNDLLTISQVENNQMHVQIQDVNIYPLVNRLVNNFSRIAWRNKSIQITKLQTDNPYFVNADPLRVEQILVNLFQNAIQHTPPGGLISVEIHQQIKTITIEIEDTGEGIPPEDLPHLWDKHYKSNSKLQSTQIRFGLGLPLVKDLLESMQGTVEVESHFGQGTLFKISLPRGKHP